MGGNIICPGKFYWKCSVKFWILHENYLWWCNNLLIPQWVSSSVDVHNISDCSPGWFLVIFQLIWRVCMWIKAHLCTAAFKLPRIIFSFCESEMCKIPQRQKPLHSRVTGLFQIHVAHSFARALILWTYLHTAHFCHRRNQSHRLCVC